MKKSLVVYAAMVLFTFTIVAAGCAPKNAGDQTTLTESDADGVKGDKHRMNPETTPAATTSTAPAATGKTGAATAAAAAATAAKDGGFDKKVFYDFDSFEITGDSAKALDDLAAFLKANPGLKVQISGHCDERGTSEYNMALGDRRAKAAKEYCVNKGIDAKRISTISYGEEKPADPGHTEEAWTKNRRAEFSFSK